MRETQQGQGLSRAGADTQRACRRLRGLGGREGGPEREDPRDVCGHYRGLTGEQCSKELERACLIGAGWGLETAGNGVWKSGSVRPRCTKWVGPTEVAYKHKGCRPRYLASGWRLGPAPAAVLLRGGVVVESLNLRLGPCCDIESYSHGAGSPYLALSPSRSAAVLPPSRVTRSSLRPWEA